MNIFNIKNNVLLNARINEGLVIIPKNVTKIDNRAFAGTNAIAVILPDSVKEIGDYAFLSCPKLNRIFITNNVKKIGFHAFEDCPQLTIMLEAKEKLIDWDEEFIAYDSVDLVKWGYSRPIFDDEYIKYLQFDLGTTIIKLITVMKTSPNPERFGYIVKRVDTSLTLYEEAFDHALYLEKYFNDSSLTTKIKFLREYYNYIVHRCEPDYITNDEANYWYTKVLTDTFARNDIKKYTQTDIKNISNTLDDAIRELIHLRRADDYLPIMADRNLVFKKTQKKAQKAYSLVRDLFDYTEKNDTKLRAVIDFLVPNYNYFLDLSEGAIKPTKSDAKYWDNKPYM